VVDPGLGARRRELAVSAGRVEKKADGADWRELGDIMFRNVWGKQQLRLRACVIDSRYRRDEVLDFVRRISPSHA
jgi:hypothetical protein